MNPGRTRDSYELERIDLQLRPLYEAVTPLEITKSNLAELRETFLRNSPPPTAGVIRKQIQEHGVSGILFVKAGSTASSTPLVLWFHGGGYRTGGPTQGIELCEQLVNRGISVFAPRYRLAPEFPFPAANEDALRSWDWVTGASIAKHGLKPTRFGLWGVSAGAGLAASTTLRLRDLNHAVQPSVLVLTIPWVARPPPSPNDGLPSWHTVKQTKLWSYSGACTAAEWYDPERGDSNGYAFPQEAQSLRDFPPTTVSVAELDILRDSGVQFALRLMDESSNGAALHCYPGTFHGSVALVPAAEVSKGQIEEEIRFAQVALGI